MKNILCFFIIVLLILSILTGCSNEEEDTQSTYISTVSQEQETSTENTNIYNSMNIDELSEAFIHIFLKDSAFEEINRNFPVSDTLKSEIKPEHYSDFSEQIKNRNGDFVGIIKKEKTVDEKNSDLSAVVYNCKGKKSDFTVTLLFDKNELCGFEVYPPLDFTGIEDGIKLKIGEQGSELPGVLLLPDNYEKKELVIILPGSGPQDLNGSVGFIKPYRDFAQGLYEHDIAVYRFNKRTYFYELDPETLTPQEELIDDVLDIIEFFTSKYSYKFNKIYLAGHSLGGYFLPKIYESAKNKGIEDNLSGLIYLAANVSPLEDGLVDQYKLYVDEHQLTDSEEWKAIIKSAEITRERIKGLNENSIYTSSQLMNLGKQYHLFLQDYNPAAEASKINLPMLFLFAENDKNVFLSEMEKWQIGLKDKENAEFIVFERLNHCFIEGTGWLAEDALTEGSVSNEEINKICSWVNEKGR